MISKGIRNNGYDYADLGLPSGTLWATCNVGASKPSDYGLYFQWGDVKGYAANQVGKDNGKKKFAMDWSDYKWGAYPNFTRYKETASILVLTDDAAQINMGGDWHLPYPAQIDELIDNTTIEWKDLNGVKGMLFTSKKDTAKSIFIPAAGYALDGSISLDGCLGYIWAAILSIYDNCIGQFLYLNKFEYGVGDKQSERFYGFPIRGVIG